MVLRTYQCPGCGHRETIEVARGHELEDAPECPNCASDAYHQDFVPFGILGPAHKAAVVAENVAVAQMEHRDETGKRDAENELRTSGWVKEATRIVEQAREQGVDLSRPEPDKIAGPTMPVAITSPMVQSAVSWGQADKRRSGEGSPVEKLLSDINTGRAPDMNRAFRRNCYKVT